MGILPSLGMGERTGRAPSSAGEGLGGVKRRAVPFGRGTGQRGKAGRGRGMKRRGSAGPDGVSARSTFSARIRRSGDRRLERPADHRESSRSESTSQAWKSRVMPIPRRASSASRERRVSPEHQGRRASLRLGRAGDPHVARVGPHTDAAGALDERAKQLLPRMHARSCAHRLAAGLFGGGQREQDQGGLRQSGLGHEWECSTGCFPGPIIPGSHERANVLRRIERDVTCGAFTSQARESPPGQLPRGAFG